MGKPGGRDHEFYVLRPQDLMTKLMKKYVHAKKEVSGYKPTHRRGEAQSCALSHGTGVGVGEERCLRSVEIKDVRPRTSTSTQLVGGRRGKRSCECSNSPLSGVSLACSTTTFTATSQPGVAHSEDGWQRKAGGSDSIVCIIETKRAWSRRRSMTREIARTALLRLC